MISRIKTIVSIFINDKFMLFCNVIINRYLYVYEIKKQYKKKIYIYTGKVYFNISLTYRRHALHPGNLRAHRKIAIGVHQSISR